MPKYATVYARPDSPYWWIAYWSPRRRKRVGEATPFRKLDHGSKRRALALATERSQDAIEAKEDAGTNWEEWVETWLKLRHRSSALTLQNYLIRWSHLFEYLTERKVHAPRYLTPDIVTGYLTWRTAQVKPSSGRSPTFNTALMEIGLLGRVMREAIRRGHADHNPAEKLGLKKDVPAEKPEITDDEVRTIRAALADRPEWMQVTFEIALHQGCRLKETQIPFTRIDLSTTPPRVQFHAKQGKVFTTQLHPELVPLITKLRATPGRQFTCQHPPMAAKEWHFFFKEVGLPHLCFHSTRVTVVTRMARAGVPIQMAMAYVGHANALIHKIYQRLKPADVGPAIGALTFSPTAG